MAFLPRRLIVYRPLQVGMGDPLKLLRISQVEDDMKSLLQKMRRLLGHSS